jgi:chromosome segregation ATPase
VNELAKAAKRRQIDVTYAEGLVKSAKQLVSKRNTQLARVEQSIVAANTSIGRNEKRIADCEAKRPELQRQIDEAEAELAACTEVLAERRVALKEAKDRREEARAQHRATQAQLKADRQEARPQA